MKIFKLFIFVLIKNRLRQTPPFDLSFYQRYIEIEKCAAVLDEQKIQMAFEDALKHFAKNNSGKAEINFKSTTNI